MVKKVETHKELETVLGTVSILKVTPSLEGFREGRFHLKHEAEFTSEQALKACLKLGTLRLALTNSNVLLVKDKSQGHRAPGLVNSPYIFKANLVSLNVFLFSIPTVILCHPSQVIPSISHPICFSASPQSFLPRKRELLSVVVRSLSGV